MHKVIHTINVKSAIQALGWTQKELAAQLGVTGQAVTNWMKGTDFPRPDKLLKLATTLKLGFSDLVQLPQDEQPVVAFRKKAGAKTKDEHVLKALGMGALLKALVPYLSPLPQLRRQLSEPSTEYAALQDVVAQVRKSLGLGEGGVLHYELLLGEFADNGAVVVPVMWGTLQNHKNALHILLPQERVTFIFLNLDTYREDFKFWMAHELAHVLFNRGDIATPRRFFSLNTNPALNLVIGTGIVLPDVRIYRRIQTLHSADPNNDPNNDNILNWARRRRAGRFPVDGSAGPATATTGNTLTSDF